MGISIKKGFLGSLSAGNNTLYICPPNTEARVINCTATNQDYPITFITFHKVFSGGSVGDEYLIKNEDKLGPKETDDCLEVVGQTLIAGDFLNAIPGTANKITLALDIVEVI